MPRVTKYDENDEPISGYRLVGFLGAGQFGEVWKAVEPATGKLVAIKIIDLSHSNSALKELKALNLVKNLNHPNLIPIFTARLKDKNNREIPLHKTEELKGKGVLRELVIAMGLGDKSLSARLKELNPDGTDPQDFRGLPVDELLGYMQGAAKGIDFLNKADHGLGSADGPIVHCDIKPDNMMIVAGEVQIVDCGVAVIITPDVRQTKAAGSPAYSAPELTGNKPVPGTDQYALAISYYELRTGSLPFDDQMGQLSIMLAHAEGRLDFTSSVITEEERKVLKWATAVQPKARYLTCSDMVKQLERAIEGLSPLEPGKVMQRSGVVPTSKSRVAPPPPLDPSMLRSTPNLPSPTATPARPPVDPFVSFDPPEPREDLRGTVIPGSDRLLPPTDSGLTLPARPGDVAAFNSSQSDIEMPVGNDDFQTEDDFSETSAHGGSPRLDARGPVDPATRSTDVSRPQISVDGNDPMGARAGSVELDPEIAKIIKGSGGAKPTSMRLPSSPSVQTQRPQSRSDISPGGPGKRATEYPRDTPDDDEAKSLPPWAKEAKAAEQQASRPSMPSLPTTNWKEPDAAKSGGMGAKLIVGGVLAAGIAGLAGAYFSGLIGGAGSSSSSSSGVDPKPKPPDPNPKPPDPKPQPEPEKVDPELLKAIDDLIAMKAGTDFVAALAKYDIAQAKIDGLPKSAIYEEARTSRKNRLTEFRAEIDAAITVRAGDIDRLIKSADPKDPTASEKTFLEAERLIGQLPRVLPTGLMDKRTAWSNDIGKQRVAMAGSEDERKFLAALLGLEKLPATTLTTQAKDIYTVNLDLDRRKKIGAKLVAIGEQKTEYRDAIIQFLVEDRGRFDLMLPTDADKQPIFKWRTAPVKALADSLRTKLAALTTGQSAKSTVDDINSAIAELKNRKKTVGTSFGPLWNDKLLDPEIDKIYNLATMWSEAESGFGNGISPLRKYVQQAAAPDLALPMALEYMRIGINKSESIADLRSVRDYSKNWMALAAADRQRLDDYYQLALARQVRKDLAPASGKPNWADIVKSCEKDDALGWRAVAEAESRLNAKTALGDLSDVAAAKKDDDTADDRKTFIAYLKAAAKADKSSIAELQKLYQAKPLSNLLSTSFRRSYAARTMADAAIAKVEFKGNVEDLLAGQWKPYASDATALGFLSAAFELDGAANPDWAIQLHFLADASGDSATAQMAAGRVGSEVLGKASGPLALAFLVKRASNRSATAGSRIADRATVVRMAQTLFEAEPIKDADKRQRDFREELAKFAKVGLDEPGGSNADRRTLEFPVFRQEYHGNTVYDKAWIDKARDQIGPIATDLPTRDPLRADALAYRALITLNRFHFSRPFGDLKKDAVSETVREREWNGMIADAENALAIEKENPIASQVLSYAYFGMFSQATSYVPPDSLIKKYNLDDRRDKDTVLKVAGHLKNATESPRAAKITESSALLAYLRVRSQFLLAAGNAFAKRGEPNKDVRDLLVNADKSAEQTIRLRPEKQVADHTVYGRILEDLAWIGQESSAENYRKSLEMYRTATGIAPTTAVLREEVVRGHMDMARATVRAVQFGYFSRPKLSDTDTAWTALDAAIESLPEAERGGQAVKSIQAEAAYWKAVRKLVAGRSADAAAAFAAASESLRVNDANHYVPALVHRAEAILEGTEGRDAITEILAAVEPAGGIVFAADYIKARKAVADNDFETAKGHFDGAYRKIQSAWRSRDLKMDDPFALRCLAHELKAVKNLGAQERVKRKDLLKELQSAYAWTLTATDKEFIADALK
jgi:serine/threonine protein kinase